MNDRAEFEALVTQAVRSFAANRTSLPPIALRAAQALAQSAERDTAQKPDRLANLAGVEFRELRR
jgi:hypothetical protein